MFSFRLNHHQCLSTKVPKDGHPWYRDSWNVRWRVWLRDGRWPGPRRRIYRYNLRHDPVRPQVLAKEAPVWWRRLDVAVVVKFTQCFRGIFVPQRYSAMQFYIFMIVFIEVCALADLATLGIAHKTGQQTCELF